MITDETICAVSTAPGMGAIAIVRLAGPQSLAIADSIFQSPNAGKKLSDQRGGTFHYGNIIDEKKEVIDEVVVSVYRKPHSFTGEDMIEVACHGSVVIQQQIMQLLIKKGARTAGPGEFTQRAFANGKMDLSQAEAVADLIAAQSNAARRVALKQMKGGLSNELTSLRQDLLKFCTLLELELDFSEEDVEFADRSELITLITKIDNIVTSLSETFRIGNAIKNGVPVAIVGPTNAGKSTLLNTLLNEERAIVSDIHGTTRDTIEDTMFIDGIEFRFIDTAGLRHTTDTIEQIGIDRTYNKIKLAQIVLAVVDSTSQIDYINDIVENVTNNMNLEQQKLIVVLNKSDIGSNKSFNKEKAFATVEISAKEKTGIDVLTQTLVKASEIDYSPEATIVTNARHYEALVRSHEELRRVHDGLTSNLSGELVSIDIHDVLDELASITGEVSSQDVLNNIFAHFCIGK